MQHWWIGCSGFHYKPWKGIFYPEDLPQLKWFEFYADHFKTLELNVTFYRFPQLSFLQNWYAKSPAGFKFAVKAPRAITHYKQFVDAKKLTGDFYETIKEGLQEKLGCVLFQMPPRMKYTEEKLQQIIDTLDNSFTNVVEFRHESWWNREVYETLAKHKITFCSISHPTLPDDIIQYTKTVYYRFHGVPQLYKSAYSLAALKKVADAITAHSQTKEIFVYFNNDIDVAAIYNAKDLEKYVTQKT